MSDPISDAVARCLALVAHRRRKQAAAQALGSQIHALADVAFPGLTACFRTGPESKTLRMLMATLADPARVATMSREEVVRYAAQQQARMTRPKAAQVIAAAASRAPCADGWPLPRASLWALPVLHGTPRNNLAAAAHSPPQTSRSVCSP